MTRWSPRSRCREPRVLGIGIGVRSVWMAAPWRSPTTRTTRKPSDGRRPVGGPALTRKCASCPWWKNGTHVLFGTQMSGYGDGEITLAHKVLPALKPGMLCLADRNFYGYDLWKKARASGADLLWRVKKNLRLPCEERLSDGSYLSTVYRSDKDRRRGSHGIRVRVIEYTLEGVAGAEPIYRLVTSILDPGQAPAQELAALYHERWEIETALDELKTHLRGSKIVLRSKTPELVRQEFYGLMMTHFA